MIDLFSKQERIFIIFLMVGVLVGSGIEFYKSRFKPNRNTDHLKSLEIFEKRIKEKAALIDSLQQVNQLSSEASNLFTGKKSKANAINQGESRTKYLRVDINSATVEQLVQIPNIGPVIANRIVEYRTANGKFNLTEELINIKGIGEKKLNLIKQYIFINNNK